MTRENYIFAVGVGSYPLLKERKELENPVRDAKRVSEVLVQRYGFAQKGLLLDEVATSKNILKHLSALQENCGRGDNVIIFIAGHAVLQQFTSKGHFISADAETAKEGIMFSSILEAIGGIAARHVLLVMDCCYSGAMINGPKNTSTTSVAEELEGSDSRWVFTSCGETRSPNGNDGENSPFSHALCHALEDNITNELTLSDLFARLLHGFDISKYPKPQMAEIAYNHRGANWCYA